MSLWPRFFDYTYSYRNKSRYTRYATSHKETIMDTARLDILVVEDSDEHAELITRNLRKSSLVRHIDRVASGEDALKYLRREEPFADKTPPGLVLLDLNLPKVNGHEVLYQIKSDERLQYIPVVVLSSSNAEYDRKLAMQHNANNYLIKPFDNKEFEAMIGQLTDFWTQWSPSDDKKI